MTPLGQVFSDLVRYETRLYNALGARLKAEHGLVASQFEFLRLIATRERCRVNDLAQEVVITTGAASKAVDRLEAAGWVQRLPHPDNRRSSVLALTDAGERILVAADATVESALTTWLAEPLDGASFTTFGAAMARLRTAAEHAELGVPTG